MNDVSTFLAFASLGAVALNWLHRLRADRMQRYSGFRFTRWGSDLALCLVLGIPVAVVFWLTGLLSVRAAALFVYVPIIAFAVGELVWRHRRCRSASHGL